MGKYNINIHPFGRQHMERTRQKKWLVVLFFGSICLLLSYFVYFIASGATDPAYGQWASTISQSTPTAMQTDDNYLLPLDQGLVIDGLEITYRGKSGPDIMLDLVILALDKEYAYRYKIPLKSAKKGFLLSRHPFKVVSINSQKVLLTKGGT